MGKGCEFFPNSDSFGAPISEGRFTLSSGAKTEKVSLGDLYGDSYGVNKLLGGKRSFLKSDYHYTKIFWPFWNPLITTLKYLARYVRSMFALYPIDVSSMFALCSLNVRSMLDSRHVHSMFALHSFGFALLASVFRSFTPRNKHLLSPFNKKRDLCIEAHILV